MNVSDKFQTYSETVCAQIRWKKAHGAVAKEIENHLLDQKNAYLAQGDAPETAEEKAILQMGDPVAIGAELDNTYKPAPQRGMIGLVLLLFLLGIFMRYQLMQTDIVSPSLSGSIFWYGMGLLAFLATYFLDFSFFGKHPYLLPLLLLGVTVWMQCFGIRWNGQNWFLLGPLSIGSGMLSLLFPLGFCGIVYHLRQKGKAGYLYSGLLAGFACLLLLTLHTSGGIFVFVCAAGSLLLLAAQKNWFASRTKPLLLGFALIGLLCGAILIGTTPYRAARISALFFPNTTDAYGISYFARFLRTMLQNASLLGSGMDFTNGAGIAQLQDAEFRANYLFTCITYSYGWVVSLGLILLLLLFLGLGFRKCLRQKSILGQMVSFAILCTFTAETALYLIGNLGVVLVAPLSLPFLSYGGASACIHMALAGILLSVFRTGEVFCDAPLPQYAEQKRIQWENGKLTIFFRT